MVEPHMCRARLLDRALFLAWAASLAAMAHSQTLALLNAGTKGTNYEVVPGTCTHHECPIVVRLIQAGRILDSYSLETPASSRDFKPARFVRTNGAGDPLASSENAPTFTSGDEEDAVTVAIRRVRMTPSLAGVLFDLRFGFERLKRRHEILAEVNGKLRKIWSAEEGDGPTYSTTALSPLPGGRDRLVYFSFFTYPGEDAPDKVSAESLSYDSRTGRFLPHRAPLLGLLAGPFSSIAEAQKERSSWRKCRIPFWVLPGPALGVTKPGFVLATFSTRPAEINRVNAAIKTCAAETAFTPYSTEQGSISIW